jgi:hypothetical protein
MSESTETPWTECQIDAALCLWEYALSCKVEKDLSVFNWMGGDSGGTAFARQICIELAKNCDRSYHIAHDLGYDDCFDWEFVPCWVREAMKLTTIHDLEAPWIDFIGRKIYQDYMEIRCIWPRK